MASTYRVIVRKHSDGLGSWLWVCEHCGRFGCDWASQAEAQRDGLRHLADAHSLAATLEAYYAGVTAAALAARAREDDDDPWGEHDDVNGLHRLDAPQEATEATETGARPESFRGHVPDENLPENADYEFDPTDDITAITCHCGRVACRHHTTEKEHH